MKHFLFAMGAIALVSCNSNEAKVAGASDDAVKKNRENMQTVYHALETGDTSKVGVLLADDFADHNANPDNTDIKGRDSALKSMAEFHTFFDNLKMEMLHDATSSDGNYIFCTIRMTGKAKANPMGIPVGEDIDDEITDVVKLKDGKAVDHWGYISWGDFNQIMKSVMSMPPAQPGVKDSTGKK